MTSLTLRQFCILKLADWAAITAFLVSPAMRKLVNAIISNVCMSVCQ